MKIRSHDAWKSFILAYEKRGLLNGEPTTSKIIGKEVSHLAKQQK
jgi:hypothetical protein